MKNPVSLSSLVLAATCLVASVPALAAEGGFPDLVSRASISADGTRATVEVRNVGEHAARGSVLAITRTEVERVANPAYLMWRLLGGWYVPPKFIDETTTVTTLISVPPLPRGARRAYTVSAAAGATLMRVHSLADARRQLAELSETNNGSVATR
jgi:hypothetical protein